MVLILFAFLSLARSRVRELSPSGARAGSHSLFSVACMRALSFTVRAYTRASSAVQLFVKVVCCV